MNLEMPKRFIIWDRGSITDTEYHSDDKTFKLFVNRR